MSLSDRVEELRSDIETLREELEGKDAVLMEAVAACSCLPPQPGNYSLIESILGFRMKEDNAKQEKFQCRVHSTFLFDNFLCIAIEVDNLTAYKSIASGSFVCCSASSSGYSETTSVIFDGLNSVGSIGGNSKRRILATCPKGILLDQNLLFVIELRLITTDSPIGSKMLSALPAPSCNGNLRINFSFSVVNPVRPLISTSVLDLTVPEGILFYQTIYTCYASRASKYSASQLCTVLRSMRTFEAVDFGDWQIMIGEEGTLHEGLVCFCVSSQLDEVPPQCRIFTRERDDLKRFESLLRRSMESS